MPHGCAKSRDGSGSEKFRTALTPLLAAQTEGEATVGAARVAFNPNRNPNPKVRRIPKGLRQSALGGAGNDVRPHEFDSSAGSSNLAESPASAPGKARRFRIAVRRVAGCSRGPESRFREARSESRIPYCLRWLERGSEAAGAVSARPARFCVPPQDEPPGNVAHRPVRCDCSESERLARSR